MRASSIAPVVAAGALVWRVRAGQLQVVLVHRPKYKDWSWPKGKVEPGESIVGAAVRELAEETGFDIVLGMPLPTVSYRIAGRPKQVHYWAAQIAGRGDTALVARPHIPRTGRDEIDEVEWFDVDEADTRLTRASDRRPLKALREAFSQGTLDTRALVITRHARARKRASWRGDETDRPLTRTGILQADDLVTVLSAYGVSHIITSPWRRCHDTVAGFANAADIAMEERAELTEAAHEESATPVAELLDGLMDTTHDVVVCTHRPVLPTVMGVIRSATPRTVLRTLPTQDPYLRPGHSLVVHLSAGRVISAEIVIPSGFRSGTTAAPKTPRRQPSLQRGS